MRQILQGFLDTPPLWRKQQFGLQQFEFPTVDIDLAQNIELPSNLRLGHQMEHVFKNLIAASSKYEVVYSNLLIEENKVRIGELDFILKDLKTQKHLHVELAYKFYLINPEISEPLYRLMGPNKRDMWYTKLDKLKEKQLPLLFHQSLQPYWEAIGVRPQDMEQYCCIKSQLFQPFGENASIRPLNMDCIAGRWIRFEEFNNPEFHKNEFYIPKKIAWVVKPHHQVDWKNHYETLMETNLHMVKKNAPMLWMKTQDQSISKLFVVWW